MMKVRRGMTMSRIDEKPKKNNSHRICASCETGQLREQSIGIKVGSAVFDTMTMVCLECGAYALTPKVRREMDEWGTKFTRNIVEPQPLFSEASHNFLDEMAIGYGLTKVPFIKILTTFYLNHIVNRPDFGEVKKIFAAHEPRRLLEGGLKAKVSLPIRYLLFRKLQVFCDVWEVSHAKAIEEATLFCLTALTVDEKNLANLKAIAKSLKGFISDTAQAA